MNQSPPQVWQRHLLRVSKWYAGILFAHSPVSGFLVFLACLGTHDYGFSAFVCANLSYFFAVRLAFPEPDLEAGIFCTNSILLGLYLGTTFTSPPLLFFLIMAGSLFMVFLFRSLSQFLGGRLRLPVCSYPFTLGVLLLSFITRTQEVFFLTDLGRPFTYSTGILEFYWYQSFLETMMLKVFREGHTFVLSMGAILFQKALWASGIACLAVLLHSRVQFILALSGFSMVRLVLAFLPFQCSGFETLFGFNAILIGIALGGTFFVPEWVSFLNMLGAQFMGLLLGIFGAGLSRQFGVEVTALPFNLTISLVLLALQDRAFQAKPYQPLVSLPTPEELIVYYNRYHERIFLRGTALPFFGKWKIVQAFDGTETHKSHWRFGVDFAVTDDANQSFRGTGILPDDYYCFGAPVRSPVAGTVVETCDTVLDNPLGEINVNRPWGNYVIIHSAGIYVGLYHLKKDSIQVVAGQAVITGFPVAKVGNSGRSAYPHLHFQLQLSPMAGAANLPFQFQNVIVRDEASRAVFHPYFHPREGALVQDAETWEPVKKCFIPNQQEEWVIEMTENDCSRHQKWSFSYTLEGNVRVHSNSGETIEYSLLPNHIEVYRFGKTSLDPLNLYGILLSDLPYQTPSDLSWKTRVHGKSGQAFAHFGKRLLTNLFGPVFSVTCEKEFSESDGEAGFGVSAKFQSHTNHGEPSQYSLTARFGEQGFQEFTLFRDGKTVQISKRITPR
jgi:urea transporter